MSVDDVIRFVTALYWVYTILILLYVLFSWVQLPYNLWVGRIRTFLHDTVEPYIGLFRRVIPPLGGIDLSPMVALFALFVIQRIVVTILDGFR
jgi:YggT family protein